MVVGGHPQPVRRGRRRRRHRVVGEHDTFGDAGRAAGGDDDRISGLDGPAGLERGASAVGFDHDAGSEPLQEGGLGAARESLIDRKRGVAVGPDTSATRSTNAGPPGRSSATSRCHAQAVTGSIGVCMPSALDLFGDRQAAQIGEPVAHHLHADREVRRHAARHDRGWNSEQVGGQHRTEGVANDGGYLVAERGRRRVRRPAAPMSATRAPGARRRRSTRHASRCTGCLAARSPIAASESGYCSIIECSTERASADSRMSRNGAMTVSRRSAASPTSRVSARTTVASFRRRRGPDRRAGRRPTEPRRRSRDGWLPPGGSAITATGRARPVGEVGQLGRHRARVADVQPASTSSAARTSAT